MYTDQCTMCTIQVRVKISNSKILEMLMSHIWKLMNAQIYKGQYYESN